MLGRVAAVALSSFLFASAAVPQCNYSPVASFPFRSTTLDLFIDGGDLWTVTSYGVALYDRGGDPPVMVASVALPGTTRAVRAAGGIAYAASGNSIDVVRRNGRTLQLAASVDAGAAVNDLLITPRYLYAATAAGLAQYDLLSPLAPVRTPSSFATSGSNVTSLALNAGTLYATDGDASVEAFSIVTPEAPVRSGSFSSLPRSQAISVADGRIYVSDGQQTDIFVGSGASPTRVSVTPLAFGSTSFAPLSANAIFVAGTDRRLHAYDVSSAGAPVEIFRSDLAPSSGTVNRVTALAVADGRLYAGAGDIGLLSWDVRNFSQPFPLRSHSTVPAGSVAASEGHAYFGRPGGGVVDYLQGATGALTESKSWDPTRPAVVHDTSNDLLLTSSGASLTLWAVVSTSTPVAVGSATFASPVRQAVLTGVTAWVVLDDRTLWTVDLSQSPAAPGKVTTAAAPEFIARSGENIVIADLRADGTTVVSAVAGTTGSKTVDGIATAGVALSGTTAAVWTFRGITLIDFPSGNAAVLPQSNAVGAKQLALIGTRLVEMTDSAIVVWDTSTRKVTAQFAVPGTPNAVAVAPSGTLADVATTDGVVSVQLDAALRMPSPIAASNPNTYYKKIVATTNRIVLFDGRNADIFTTTLQNMGGIHAGGTIDVAATDGGVFTLTNTLAVNGFTRDGDPIGSTLITEGPNVQASSITTAAGAVWASITRGCPLNCEKKTLVFDPRNALVQTASFSGAVRDVAVNGTRAYVLTELPDEIRILNVSDPAHPQQIASKASEGERLPLSIAAADGVVYVLGMRLYAYSSTDLSKLGEQLPSWVDDVTSPVTYGDQRLRLNGSCAAMTGRTADPQVLNAGSTTSWTLSRTFPTPSLPRAIASGAGTFYFLTDHSLEVWSTAPLPLPARKHAAR